MVRQRYKTKLLEGFYNRENQTLRRFLLKPVTTVDDADKERVASDMKAAQDLVLIRVWVCRAIVKSEKKQIPPHRDMNLATGGIRIAEKALKGKAVSHGMGLSTPVVLRGAKPASFNIDEVDTHASPLALFYFKYRSEEALQQQLIIRRPRSLSMESELEGLSPGEIRRLACERLRQIKDGKKRALSVKDEDNTEILKTAFKFVKTEGGKNAIDLTEDN